MLDRRRRQFSRRDHSLFDDAIGEMLSFRI
jgi:hypothetical protein